MATYGDAHLKIFSLSSNHPLAEKVAASVGVELSAINLARFSDNEIQVNIEESVRGDNVYVIQSTSAPVNDNLMELMITIDALRRASAKSINIVMPYYGYARQDRKARSREPITAKLVANMLESVGATRVIAMDLHAAQIQGFFDIPVDHLKADTLLADYFIENGIDDNLVVVSPDHASVSRARRFAELLNAPIAIIDNRDPEDINTVPETVIGNVKGKRAIIVDDLIDTAIKTEISAETLKKAGATEIYNVATRAVFSGDAAQRLANSSIKKTIVTNSINIPENKRFDGLEIVSVGKLFGTAITLIHNQESVGKLFGHE